MARIGRFVVPELPHHVTQRGNRREPVFFSDADYELYRDLLHEACGREGVAVWSYCLMPNHVHLILTPTTPEGLGRALGKAHRRYSGFVNARNRVTGHLFQGRFSSVAMDEEHLMAAARYGAMNPVRARLVRRAEDWPWSSARAHLSGQDDGLVEVAPLISRCAGRFAGLIAEEPAPALIAALRAAETIGRPLGASPFLARLAALTGRDPRPRKRGRKPRLEAQDAG
jgi:putative transposase